MSTGDPAAGSTAVRRPHGTIDVPATPADQHDAPRLNDGTRVDRQEARRPSTARRPNGPSSSPRDVLTTRAARPGGGRPTCRTRTTGRLASFAGGLDGTGDGSPGVATVDFAEGVDVTASLCDDVDADPPGIVMPDARRAHHADRLLPRHRAQLGPDELAPSRRTPTDVVDAGDGVRRRRHRHRSPPATWRATTPTGWTATSPVDDEHPEVGPLPRSRHLRLRGAADQAPKATIDVNAVHVALGRGRRERLGRRAAGGRDPQDRPDLICMSAGTTIAEGPTADRARGRLRAARARRASSSSRPPGTTATPRRSTPPTSAFPTTRSAAANPNVVSVGALDR